MRRSPLLLVVAVFTACTATPAGDEVVGPWLRLEHGNPAAVSELLAIELGHRAAVGDGASRRSPRPEIDAADNAVRWRGSSADVARAPGIVSRLDIAREPDPRDSLRQVSAWFTWPGPKQAELVQEVDREFYAYAYFADERGCRTVPVFRCAPDPSLGVVHVRGDAWSLPALCEWMRQGMALVDR